MRLRFAAALLLPLLAVGLAAQQGVGPMPAPLPPPLPAPRDVPYAPGAIQLNANFTNVAQRIIQVRETIPVAPGALTLLYPAWIPGNHAADGPIKGVGGLVITANGQPVHWTRSDVDVYAFHLTVPAGASTLDVRFQYLVPLNRSEGRVSFDHNIIDLSWNTVVLYPAGYFSRDINCAPSVTMPAGWKFATALTTASHTGPIVHFATVPLNTLVDSPLYAGVNDHRYNLSPNASDIYKLVYNDTEPKAASRPRRFGASFSTSIGLSVAASGDIARVWWGGVAFKAGLAPGMQIEAVNSQVFAPAVLRTAILAAEHSSAPISLLVKHATSVSTYTLDYHHGLRIPHLEPVTGSRDRLDAILAPVHWAGISQ